MNVFMDLITSFLSNITGHDIFLVGLLVFLEGVLSVDNALVLAILVKRLPEAERQKALTYGIGGAFFFRIVALSFTTYLTQWMWLKFVGGGYLILLALKNLWAGFKKDSTDDTKALSPVQSFWKTVLIIELTDIAFALDSILAAVALTQKLWIVITGGILGIIMMRFAASAFVHLLEKFPRIERVAYVLVLLIGTKVVLEGFKIQGLDFHTPREPAFIAFWGLMLITILSGFVPPSRKEKPTKH